MPSNMTLGKKFDGEKFDETEAELLVMGATN